MKLIDGLSEAELLDSHKYQFDGSHRNRNECTLCSMSMLLELGSKQVGADLMIRAENFGKELDRIPFRHPRFPAWFPGPGGATHPRAALNGLKRKILELRKEGNDYPWWPYLRSNQNQDNLESQLEGGNPTLIYGVGKSGIPHVVVPIGRQGKNWLILDPGFATQRNPMKWTEKKLSDWWQGYWLIYSRGTLISLEMSE